jgi:hypothetical protein
LKIGRRHGLATVVGHRWWKFGATQISVVTHQIDIIVPLRASYAKMSWRKRGSQEPQGFVAEVDASVKARVKIEGDKLGSDAENGLGYVDCNAHRARHRCG